LFEKKYELLFFMPLFSSAKKDVLSRVQWWGWGTARLFSVRKSRFEKEILDLIAPTSFGGDAAVPSNQYILHALVNFNTDWRFQERATKLSKNFEQARKLAVANWKPLSLFFPTLESMESLLWAFSFLARNFYANEASLS
jgi:hypothetical protein